MKIKDLIAQLRAGMAKKLEERNTHRSVIERVREACASEENRDPSEDEARQVREAQEAIRRIDADLAEMRGQVEDYEEEQARDEAADRLAREVLPTGTAAPSSEERAVVTREPRTYSRESDRNGSRFLLDVGRAQIFGDVEASQRLARHMAEERVERGDLLNRADSTSSFSGLVIPQYLTDLYAPLARAGRPFADACRHHDLPAEGMVANIGKVTTGTTADVQSAENAAVDETDIDDTLMQISIQTAAGSQTISRQALERGAGVEDTTMQDLHAAHATKLDSLLLNQATNGLTNVATSISYTSSSPTAAELYPKLLAGPAAVEAALLNQALGDTLAVMHSRRWYWIQSQLSSSWPLFGQPGVTPQLAGENYGQRYGAGFRGVLPSGVPVIVDNNIVTNLGAGTNQDEVYFGAQSEFHLWEDPNAPMLIRAEQTQAKKLAVDFVVYSYFAYTHARRAHAQKISGTGLVTPTF